MPPLFTSKNRITSIKFSKREWRGRLCSGALVACHKDNAANYQLHGLVAMMFITHMPNALSHALAAARKEIKQSLYSQGFCDAWDNKPPRIRHFANEDERHEFACGFADGCYLLDFEFDGVDAKTESELVSVATS